MGSVVRTSELLVLTTLGRLLRLAGFARLKIEARDRTSARTGPHSRMLSLSPEGGILKKQKFLSSVIVSLQIIQNQFLKFFQIDSI